MTNHQIDVFFHNNCFDGVCNSAVFSRLYRLVAQERGRSEFWLFAIDVDNLKIVNNRFKSHQVTDAALAEFAARIRSVLRPELDYVVGGGTGPQVSDFPAGFRWRAGTGDDCSHG